MTNIIIPYRNRENHLSYFLNNTYPLIKKYIPDSNLVIVEQADDKLFNRGKLINVGFLEFKNDYIIIQDVDTNPIENIVKDLYTLNESILGIYTSICDTLGGIIKISSEDFKKINGFHNDYWGWGCEDKNLQNRAEFFNIKIRKTNVSHTEDDKNFIIFDDVNDRVTDNPNVKEYKDYREFQMISEEEKLNSIMSSGLNNIEYEVIDRQFVEDGLIKIKVKL